MTLLPASVVRCALLTTPFLVVGCSAGAETAPTGTATTSSATSAPTTAVDPEQQAAEEAVALVPTYVETVNGLLADPTRPIDDIYTVAVDPEATTEAGAIQAFRSSGIVQVGIPQIVGTTTVSVDLEPTSQGSLPSVQVTACLDASQVTAVDASGAPVSGAAQAPFLVVDLTIVNINYPDPQSWRVSSAPNTQAQACPG